MVQYIHGLAACKGRLSAHCVAGRLHFREFKETVQARIRQDGKYLKELLREGGFGEVFFCFQKFDDRAQGLVLCQNAAG